MTESLDKNDELVAALRNTSPSLDPYNAARVMEYAATVLSSASLNVAAPTGETPRTDAFYRQWDGSDLSEIVEHGRQLERELSIARRLLGDGMKRIRELETIPSSTAPMTATPERRASPGLSEIKPDGNEERSGEVDREGSGSAGSTRGDAMVAGGAECGSRAPGREADLEGSVTGGGTSVPSATRRIGPEACDSPSGAVLNMNLLSGDWYCHGCGASQREPACKYRKSVPA